METKKAKARINFLQIGLLATISLTAVFGGVSAWAYMQIGNSHVRITDLEAEKKTLQAQISNLTAQIDNLTDQIDALTEPKLIQVNLNVEDVRPLSSQSYLHITGEIVNVGANSAHNSKLRVVAYQKLVLAIDQYLPLGTINGQSWVEIDSNIPYNGDAIDVYTVTADWTE